MPISSHIPLREAYQLAGNTPVVLAYLIECGVTPRCPQIAELVRVLVI